MCRARRIYIIGERKRANLVVRTGGFSVYMEFNIILNGVNSMERAGQKWASEVRMCRISVFFALISALPSLDKTDLCRQLSSCSMASSSGSVPSTTTQATTSTAASSLATSTSMVPGSSATTSLAPGGTPRSAATTVSATSFQSMLDQSVQAAIASALPHIISTVDARVQVAIAAGSAAASSSPRAGISSATTSRTTVSPMGKPRSVGVAHSFSVLHPTLGM